MKRITLMALAMATTAAGLVVLSANAQSGSTSPVTEHFYVRFGAITNGADVTATGALSLSAKDTASVTSTVVAASISVAAGATGSLSLAASMALSENELGGATSALIDSATVHAATLSLSADSLATVYATSVAVSVSVAADAGFALSVAAVGAEAHNTLTNTLEAVVRDSNATANSVSLSAADHSAVKTENIVASVGPSTSSIAYHRRPRSMPWSRMRTTPGWWRRPSAWISRRSDAWAPGDRGSTVFTATASRP